MRKAFRHSGVLMMVAVVALGLLGAAYTLWFEDLRLEATVETGTLDADVSIHDLAVGSANEGLPVVALPSVTITTGGVATLLGNNYGAFTNANFPTGKPQPTCDGVVSDSSDGLNSNDNENLDNLLTLTMSGLFPYAGCEYEIDVHSDGTVPIHLAITGVSLESCTDNTFTSCGPAFPAPWSLGIDPADDDLAQCQAFLGAIAAWTGTPAIITSGGNPVQIHGTELDCRFKLILDQDPDAEGVFYKFSAEYRAFQWNETPSGPALTTP